MEGAALKAYRGMWGAFAVAARTADPTSPGLKRYATGEALKIIVKSLAVDRERGYVSKGEPVLDPRVSRLKPSGRPVEATVIDCADGTRWLKYHRDSGELVDDKPGGRHKVTATVKDVGDGVWKVTYFVAEGVGTC
ncbi:MAG: hypothetical protein ACRDT4_27295 [Micromonosporaceae bacterium]